MVITLLPIGCFGIANTWGDRIQTSHNSLRLYLTNICHINPKSHGHNPISCPVCRTIYISNFVKPLDDHVWLSVIVLCNISPFFFKYHKNIYATISIESSLEIYHQNGNFDRLSNLIITELTNKTFFFNNHANMLSRLTMSP